jgi:hypothetical protein
MLDDRPHKILSTEDEARVMLEFRAIKEAESHGAEQIFAGNRSDHDQDKK